MFPNFTLRTVIVWRFRAIAHSCSAEIMDILLVHGSSSSACNWLRACDHELKTPVKLFVIQLGYDLGVRRRRVRVVWGRKGARAGPANDGFQEKPKQKLPPEDEGIPVRYPHPLVGGGGWGGRA